MNNDDLTYDNIEDYLNGGLPEEKRALFEKQIASSPELSFMVEKHKLANTLIVERRLMDVKAMLAEQHSGTNRFTNNRTLFTTGIILTAAMMGTSSYYFTQSGNTTQQNAKAPIGIIEQQNVANQGIQTSGAEQNTKTKTYNNLYLAPETTEQISLNKDSSTQPDNTRLSTLLDTSIYRIPDVVEQVNNPTNASVKTPCDGTSIQADIRIVPSCDDIENGSIIISDIDGGKRPYSILIKNSHNETAYNTQLAKGIYSVFIQDANQCHTSYQHIEVTQKACEKDYAFNPFMGEVWKIPSRNVSGKLVLYEKSGAIFYELDIPAAYEAEWNGESKNNRLETGYYIFEINYADGTSLKGSVTIVR